MLVEWILALAANVIDWVATLLPAGEPPAFLATIDDQFNAIAANITGMSPWVDWALAITVVAAVLGAWVVAFLLKIALKILAFVPFFGGSG